MKPAGISRIEGLFCIWLFVFAIIPAVTYGQDFHTVDLKKLVHHAELIFIGDITEIDVSWSLGKESIFTYVTFENLEMIKGHVADKKIVLRQKGGSISGMDVKILGTPSFNEGDRLLIFMRHNNRSYCPIVGMTEGVYHIDQKPDQENIWVLNYNKHYLQEITGDRIRSYIDGKKVTPEKAVTKSAFVSRILEIIKTEGWSNPGIYSYLEKNADPDYIPPPPIVPGGKAKPGNNDSDK